MNFGFIIISNARKRYYRKYLLVQNTCLWVEGLKAIDEKNMEKFSEMMHKDYEIAIKKTKDIQATKQPLISNHYLFDYLLFAKKTLKDILLNSENIMKKYYQSLRIITFKEWKMKEAVEELKKMKVSGLETYYGREVNDKSFHVIDFVNDEEFSKMWRKALNDYISQQV